MCLESLYEDYHSSRKLQKRVIGEDNFTYHFQLSVIKRFGRGEQFLDIGCGVGTIDFFLATKGKSVTGIDISRNAIKIASENARLFKQDNKLSFRVMNFPKEQPKSKYDFIICSEVLEHISDQTKAISKFQQLLKNKGRVFVTTPSQNSLLYRLGLTNRYDKEVGHLRRYTLESLTGKLKEGGFRVIYTDKKEGALREALFMYSLGGMVIRMANRFGFVGDLLTLFDNFILKILGESHIFVVAQKERSL